MMMLQQHQVQRPLAAAAKQQQRRVASSAPASAAWARQQQRRVAIVTAAAAAARDDPAAAPHVQLATAKLPAAASAAVVAEKLYGWASTITQSGANFPLVLPAKVDRLPNGFALALLRRGKGGGFGAVGEMVATVEPVDGAGNVLFVRFLEGDLTAELFGGAGSTPEARLEAALAACKDVDAICATMPQAIRAAVVQAS